MDRRKSLFLLGGGMGALAAGCGSDTGLAPSPSVTPGVFPTPGPPPLPKQFDSPKAYALMHIWYKSGASSCPTVGDPITDWGPWRWGNVRLDDPCKTIAGVPWLREISSVAYPLTGPYDSRNLDIIRWQFRQMRAAGIDGAAIPVYSWAPGLEYLFDVFFGTNSTKGILQIAYEEGFTVFIEQCGLIHDQLAQYGQKYLQEINRQLDAVEASPFKSAYARLDGRLMYWVPLIGWIDDKVGFLDGTADHPRNVAWLYRNPEPYAIAGLNQRLVNATVQMVSDFNSPTYQGWDPQMIYYEDSLKFSVERAALGMVPIGDAYIGYDERGGIMAPGQHPGRYGLRNGVQQMTAYLNQSREYGARIILLESWNEWGEGSTIEAGINITRWRPRPAGERYDTDLYLDGQGQNDPFKYQKVLAQYFGIQWMPPQLPPCSAIDPLLLRNGPDWLLDLLRCTA